MEDQDQTLTNDDLLRLISFLENPADAQRAQLAQMSYAAAVAAQQSGGRIDTPLSGMGLPALPGFGAAPGGTPGFPTSLPTPYGMPSFPYIQQLGAPGSYPGQTPSATLFQTPTGHPQNRLLASSPFPQQQQQAQPHQPQQTLNAVDPQASAPSPGVGFVQPSQQLLNEILQLLTRQRDQLEKMRQIQRQIMITPQKEGYDMLDVQQKQMRLQLDQEQKALEQLHAQLVLPPADLHRLNFLQQELRVQVVQTELFHQELQQLAHPTQPPRWLSDRILLFRCFIATLVIVDQPFPMVITKGKQMDDDPITVQLLSGANVDFTHFSKMKVVVLFETFQGKPPNQQMLHTELHPIDTFRRLAKWHLKFVNGTRKNVITLKFSMQVQINVGTTAQMATIESSFSNPWVVITNECQWEESAGVLIMKDAFGEQTEIPWVSFANTLHRHFLRATRQDPVRPARCLSLHDLQYLHQKFFSGRPTINIPAYEAFWAWFGKGVQKLRYQRHLGALWQNGLIYGLLTREEVEALLRNEEVGTFLLRFSERHPGLFAVGYRVEDPDPSKCVRHYLIRPDDTAGAKKTLPDFLADQAAFTILLQVSVDGIYAQPVHRKFAKDAVLEPYYSKRSAININGYDDRVTRGAGSEGGEASLDGEEPEDGDYAG